MEDNDLTREEIKRIELTWREVVRDLKKQLKGRKRTELIGIIVDQANRALKYQDVARGLLDENKKLREKLSLYEDDFSSTPDSSDADGDPSPPENPTQNDKHD